jgi:hypothetical protein
LATAFVLQIPKKNAAGITTSGIGGFSSPGKQVSATHCAAEAMVEPRKFLAVLAVGNRRQIMLQRCTQQLEIFTGKNGAGSGWFGHCDIPFLDAAIKPLG